jgi:hypothetical protein
MLLFICWSTGTSFEPLYTESFVLIFVPVFLFLILISFSPLSNFTFVPVTSSLIFESCAALLLMLLMVNTEAGLASLNGMPSAMFRVLVASSKISVPSGTVLPVSVFWERMR